MERIAIIDGNSLINRAYYAMRNPMITKDGIFTQGIFGFLNMMEKIKKDYEPAYMVIAFDLKAPTFRRIQGGQKENAAGTGHGGADLKGYSASDEYQAGGTGGL